VPCVVSRMLFFPVIWTANSPSTLIHIHQTNVFCENLRPCTMHLRIMHEQGARVHVLHTTDRTQPDNDAYASPRSVDTSSQTVARVAHSAFSVRLIFQRETRCILRSNPRGRTPTRLCFCMTNVEVGVLISSHHPRLIEILNSNKRFLV